jgi:hypothetical protein
MNLKCIGIDQPWRPTATKLSIYERLLYNSPPGENRSTLFGLSGLNLQIHLFPVFSQQRTVGQIKGALPSYVTSPLF